MLCSHAYQEACPLLWHGDVVGRKAGYVSFGEAGSTCASSDWMPCVGRIAVLANSECNFVKEAVLLDRTLFVFAMGNNIVCSCWQGWLALMCLFCFIVSLVKLSYYSKPWAEQALWEVSPIKRVITTFPSKMAHQYFFLLRTVDLISISCPWKWVKPFKSHCLGSSLITLKAVMAGWQKAATWDISLAQICCIITKAGRNLWDDLV